MWGSCEDWRGCIACDAGAFAAASTESHRVPSKGRLTAQAASRARHLSDTNDELDRLFASEEGADEVTVVDVADSAAMAAQGTAVLRANLGNRARSRRTRAATDASAASVAAATSAAFAPRAATPASASIYGGGVSSNLFRLYFNPQDVLDALFASSSASASSAAAQSASTASQVEEGEMDVSVLAASTDVALKMEFLARKRRKHAELLKSAREMQATVLEYTEGLSRLRKETETLREKTAATLADSKRYRSTESKNSREAYKLMLAQHTLEAEIRKCVGEMVQLDRGDKANKIAWTQRASQRSKQQTRGGSHSTASSRRLQAMEGLGFSSHLQSLIDAEAAVDDPYDIDAPEPDDPLAVQSAEDAQMAYAVPQCYTTLPDLLGELLKDLLHIDPALIYDVAARVAAIQNGEADEQPGSASAATARHVPGRIDLMELGLKHLESLCTPRMLDELTKVARNYPELGQAADQIAGIASTSAATAAEATAVAETAAATAAAGAAPMETEEGIPALEGAGTQALRSLAVPPAAASAAAAAAAPTAPVAAPVVPTLSLLHLPLPPPIEVTDALLGRVRTQGRSLQSDLHRLVFDEMATLRHSLASARQGQQRARAVEEKALRAERTLKEVTRKVEKLDAEIAQLEDTLQRRTRPTAGTAAATSAPAPSHLRVHKRIRLDESGETSTEDVTVLLSDDGGDSPDRRKTAPSSAASSASSVPPLVASFPSLYPQSFRPAVHAPSAITAAVPSSSKPLRTNLLTASSSDAASAAATAIVGVPPPLLRPPGQGGKAKLAAAFDLMSSLQPSDSSGPLLASLNLSNLRAIAAQAALALPAPVQPPRENPFGIKTSASPAAVTGGAVPHSSHASSVPSDRPLASLGGLASLSGAPALSVRDRAAANARKGKSAGGEYMVRGPDGRGGSVTVMRTEEEVQRERAKKLRAEMHKDKENQAASAAVSAYAAAPAAAAKLSRQSSSTASASASAPSLFSMPNLAFRPAVHGSANQHARVHKPAPVQAASPAASGIAARVHTASSGSSPAAAAPAASAPTTAPPPALQRATSTPAPHTLAAAFSRAAAAAAPSTALSRSVSSRPAQRAARPSSAAAAAAAATRDVVVIDDDDDDDAAHPIFQAAKSATPTAATVGSALARSNSRTPFAAVQPQAK